MPSLLDILPEVLKKDINPAEKTLLEKAEKGEEADFCKGDENIDNPANADNWGISRHIRSELLYWLCVDKKAVELVHQKGININGAKIIGNLNFQFATLSHPIRLFKCKIEKISLNHADIKALYLNGSHTGSISADGLKVKGGVSLNNGFKARGEVRLLGADIGGELSCKGGVFENEKGSALAADRLKVKGNVFLDNGFKAYGEVRLLNADIGGNLECRGGIFENKGGPALNADGLKVKGNVFLDDGFKAAGEVRLVGVDIGGDLSCGGGVFENKKGSALVADRLKVKGSVFLRDGFKALGGVKLLGADIGGDLGCKGGIFENKGGYALAADRLKVNGSVFLIYRFKAAGEVSSLGAEIGGDLDCSNGIFENEGGFAFCAERMDVKGTFFWQTKEKPIGRVDLMHAKVGLLEDNQTSWPEKGRLLLDGFKYDAIASMMSVDDRRVWLRLQIPQNPPYNFKPQPYE